MIPSTPSSSERAAAANALAADANPPKPAAGSPAPEDSLSTGATGQLSQALATQPEVRPEMLLKGAAWADDPDYPPDSVIDQIAFQIVNAPDPAEED